MMGAPKTKNKLSIMAVSMVKAKAFPSGMPSLFRINTATAVPPTIDGVTAEANSHKMMTYMALVQVKCLLVTSLIRKT